MKSGCPWSCRQAFGSIEAPVGAGGRAQIPNPQEGALKFLWAQEGAPVGAGCLTGD